MTAVAVWDYQPSAHELLQMRLRTGWLPTSSSLQTGDKVLGNAACLLTAKD